MANEEEEVEVVEGEEVEDVDVSEENETETEVTEPETKAEGETTKHVESPEDRATRLLRQANQARKKIGLPALEDTKAETKSSKKSDDFGYDVKAYLKTSGIQSNEFEFVKNELKQSGLKDVDSLLDNDYFKARLEKFRAVSKTAEATPTGKRSGGVPTDSVEYWASKPIEEVPQNMRAKVVNHKLAKEKNKGVFYNS